MFAKNKKKYFYHSTRTRHNWKKIAGVFLMILSASGVVYGLYFSPLLTITDIQINGTDKINAEEVNVLVKDMTQGYYLKIIPKDRLLSFSTRGMERIILEKWKRFREVKVERIFPHGVRVTVEERQDAFLLNYDGNLFEVDEDGIAFQKVEADLASTLPIFVPGGRVDISEGAVAITQELKNYMEKIIRLADMELGWQTTEIETPSLSSGDLRFLFSNGVKIYCDTQIDPEKEIAMINLIVDQKITQEKVNCVEYIDARTDNRLYYKMKCQIETANQADAQKANQNSDSESAEKKSSKKR